MTFRATSSKNTSITHLLKNILKNAKTSKSMTYGELIAELGDQGLGMVAIFFALPSALPISVIPGFSFIFGLPIVFVALHLIIGRHVLWLPAKLSAGKVDSKKLALIIEKTLPYLGRIERFLKPRLDFFSTPLMEKLHGFTILVLSLLLLLPIPFSNFILAGIIIFFGFGIAEKDGVFLSIAYGTSIAYLSGLFWVSKGIISSIF